ncbi:hypothetical protein ACR3K2_13010 [Cryptosporidium serpentis]
MQQGRIYKSLSGKVLKSNFTDLRIGTRLSEGYGLACSTNFLGFANDGGGGCGTVLSIESAGVRKPPIMIISGHNAGITNMSFSPFYNNILATSSDDKTIKIWNLPTSGEYYNILNQDFMESQNINRNEYILNITSPASTLSGHEKRVYFCEFNHCADNILATASLDNKVVIWDMNKESEAFSISNINCSSYDLKWNYLGTLLATMNKDKKTRILDPRSESVVSLFNAHDGTRIGKCVWLEGPGGNQNKILTTGFSQTGMRSIRLWDIRSLSNCLTNIELDIISSTLYPYYQNEFRLLSIFGKGDGNIKIYEFNNENDNLNLVEEFRTTQAQRGCCFLPTRALSIDKSEVLRIYKSIGTETIDVISFSMHRKTHVYNKELFPDCFAGKPSLSAEEWINGSSRPPILISLDPSSLNDPYSPTISLNFVPDKQLLTGKTKNIISSKDLTSDLEKNSKTSIQRDISFEKKTEVEGVEKRVSRSTSILSKLSSVMSFGKKSSYVNITSKRSIFSSNGLNNEEIKDNLQSYPDTVSKLQKSNIINSSEDVTVIPTPNIDNNTISNFEINKNQFVSNTNSICCPIFDKPQVNYGDILDYRADISRTTSYIDNGCISTQIECDKPKFADISIKNNLSITSCCVDATSNTSNDYSKFVNEIKDFEVSRIPTKNLGKGSNACSSNLCGIPNSVFTPINESFKFGNGLKSRIDLKKQLVSDETNLEFNENITGIEVKEDQLNMQNPNEIIFNIISMLKLDFENVNKRLTQLDHSLKLLNNDSKQYGNKQENELNYIEELQHLKEELAKLNIQYYDLSVAYKQQTTLFGLYKEFYAELEDILAESFNSMRATVAER